MGRDALPAVGRIERNLLAAPVLGLVHRIDGGLEIRLVVRVEAAVDPEDRVGYRFLGRIVPIHRHQVDRSQLLRRG